MKTINFPCNQNNVKYKEESGLSMDKQDCIQRLRELSLMSEEERCAWVNLPEVMDAIDLDMLSQNQLLSNELMFSLIVDELIYNSELSRLVSLARSSVRWKDPMPLFNRRSITSCSLKVKKCSDALVRLIEEEWTQPQSLVLDLGRVFSILEASFNAATAQTYVAYCDNLDDTRALFRRAMQRDSVWMNRVVSARCHIEYALLPLQRICQLRSTLDKIRQVLPSDDCSQYLLQCQQLHVTISGIIECCYNVLSSHHGSNYLANIDNMLDFSYKLSSLRHKSPNHIDPSMRPRYPLPHEICYETLTVEPNSNLHSEQFLPATETCEVTNLKGSFDLIDLWTKENLRIGTKVDSFSSSDTHSTKCSDLSLPADDYELIELKELPKKWSGNDAQSFEGPPLHKINNVAGNALVGIVPQGQSKSIFYAYLDLTEDGPQGNNEIPKSNPLQPLRTLWCETNEVIKSGILDKLTPSEIALQESKFEILTSEVSYLKSLNILITLFVESAEIREVLDCEDRLNLFGNILEVRKASEIFLFDLAGQWEEDFMLPEACSLINKHAQGTFRVYIEYCSNQVRFHRTLQRLMQDSERFVPVLSVLEGLTACQGFSLQSFLMLPVQRVTRLPLLIQAIQRRVPIGTPEFISCHTALSSVNQLVHECNEGVRAKEQAEQIQALAHILHTDNKEKEETKVSSENASKQKKEKTKKRRHPRPWKIFSSPSHQSCDA